MENERDRLCGRPLGLVAQLRCQSLWGKHAMPPAFSGATMAPGHRLVAERHAALPVVAIGNAHSRALHPADRKSVV